MADKSYIQLRTCETWKNLRIHLAFKLLQQHHVVSTFTTQCNLTSTCTFCLTPSLAFKYNLKAAYYSLTTLLFRQQAPLQCLYKRESVASKITSISNPTNQPTKVLTKGGDLRGAQVDVP
jgi:hypothetical protein